jgi:hypothetical protein
LELSRAALGGATALVDLLLGVPLLVAGDGFVDEALSFGLGELGVVQLVRGVFVPLFFADVSAGDGGTSC